MVHQPKVRKRNGEIVKFEKDKISCAIKKAMKKGSGILEYKIADDIAEEIYLENYNSFTINIREIEDQVYDKLIDHDQRLTAKAYEGYRSIREFQRDVKNSTDQDAMELMRGSNEYLNTENSNKDAKGVTVMRDYLAGIMSTDITKRYLLPPEILQAHEEGILHFHDADYFAQPINNCCLINLEDMLQNGTVVNGVGIDKPKRFLTAVTIATQIITAVASSQYGGTSISLTHLAPFVRDSYNRRYEKLQKKYGKKLYKKYYEGWKDRFPNQDVFREFLTYMMNDMAKDTATELVKEEVRDGVQTFNYQINSMSTTNGQAPFISVFMYLGETEEYKEELAMIIEEFLKQRIQGMKNESGTYVTQAFPKLLYVTEEDNIKNDSKYIYLTELAAKCTAKRMVPDYISEKVMKELKEDNCYACMGCRSFLAPWKDENNNYKFWGRFNQGVVTLNLVDIALSSKKDTDKFWEIFDERTELCHQALLVRHKRLEGTVSDVAPILWQHGAFARLNKGEVIDPLLHGGYSSISLGYAGLYETVKYMTGDSHTDNGVGKELALQIMNRLNDKCEEWKELDDIGYSTYGSPIESTTYKFAKCLKKRFGTIEGITDRNYITNSYHVPVFEPIDAFTKLSLESEFQSLSTGGAISYVEMPNMSNNIEAIIKVMRFMYENIMYAEFNTKSDYCQVCGFDGEILIVEDDDKLVWECPCCKNRDQNKMNVCRRTCGYIGTNFWNEGRTQEIKERVMHLDNMEW